MLGGLVLLLSGCAWVTDDDVAAKVAGPEGGDGVVDTGDDSGDADDDDTGDDTAVSTDDTGDCEPVTWYADGDSDGFGSAETTEDACDAPSGFVADSTDCDDTDAAVYPGARDACGDGVDADCAGGEDDCALSGDVDIDAAAQLVLEGSVATRAATDIAATGDLDGDGVVEIAVGVKAVDEFSGAFWVIDPAVPRGVPLRSPPGDVAWATEQGVADENLAEFMGPVGPLQAGGAGGLWASGRDGTNEDGLWRIYADPPISGSLAQHAVLRLDVPGIESYTGQAAATGDVNGDGVADLLLRSGIDTPATDESGAWLVLGPLAGNVDVRGVAGFELMLEPGFTTMYAADSVALCDVDGDGRDEAIIGAPNYTGDDGETGTVHFIDEPPTDGTVLVRGDLDRFEAAGTWSRTGLKVDCGNLDGDGLADVVVRATDATSSFVGAIATGASIDASGPGGLLDGPQVGAGAGEPGLLGREGTMSVIPDANGDGVDDLAVAWPSAAVGGDSAAGWVAVFDGPFDGQVTLGDARAQLRGVDADQELGDELAGVGDLDGDGTGELLVLSRERYTGEEGWAYLFMGGL